jgi:hypothetical protein
MELSDATVKTPATPGIDPETFRPVAQCLNHYATPGPGGGGSGSGSSSSSSSSNAYKTVTTEVTIVGVSRDCIKT